MTAPRVVHMDLKVAVKRELPEDPVLLARLRLLVLEPYRLGLACKATELATIHPQLPELLQRLQQFPKTAPSGLLRYLCWVSTFDAFEGYNFLGSRPWNDSLHSLFSLPEEA